ncbi:MAG: M28 family peptidase [Elusimicrobiales bacterium]|nr:M28 family peptidase [Elusimicrobiales bacterium]
MTQFTKKPTPAADIFLTFLALANFSGAALHASLLYSRAAAWAGIAGLASWLLFLAAARLRTPGFWTPPRARLAALACGLWGLYLLLFSAGLTYWLLDIIFSIIALLLLLGRTRPDFLAAGLGIFAVIGIRHIQNDFFIALLSLLLCAWAVWRGPGLAERLTAARVATPGGKSPVRTAVTVALFSLLAVYVARPVFYMVYPPARHKALLALAPAFPVTPPEKLTPQAARLHAHVVALAGKIGERSAYQPDQQDQARDYITAEFKKAGYTPELLEYSAQLKSDSGRTRPYYNVEARLTSASPAPGGAWVLAAHYDTAPGTPGADDNASAVAILLEAARLLRRENPAREIRLVAFGTEEPPSFTTRDMGSFRYLRYLKERGVKVHGLLNLEMLGYFNPKPGAQLFPPFMNLLHPETGDFVSLASNLSSYGLMKSIEKTWKRATALPIETVFLPSVPSALFISDHLNFWFSGERAVMLGDTAYFRNPNYHQDSDTPDTLDYERMAEIVRAVTAVTLE